MSDPKPARRTYIILSIVAILAVLVFAFAYIEVTASRRDLLSAKRNEAVTLLESMVHGTEASIAANALLEDLIDSHLRTTAQFIRHRERSGGVTPAYLQQTARSLDVTLLAIVGTDGKIESANLPLDTLDPEMQAAIDSIQARGYRWYIVPSMEAGTSNGTSQRYYALALARADKPGAVIAALSEDVLLDYRRRTGSGSMLQDIANNDEILYVLIQDEEGILTASKGISSMSSIGSDPFLVSAFGMDSTFTRIVDYGGDTMLEAVQRVNAGDGVYYLARVGLSLEHVQEIQQRSMRRVILIGAALVALGALALGFLFTRRRFFSLQREHTRVKASTGLIMENIADGVVAIDAEGAESFMNAAARECFAGDSDPLADEDPLFLRETLHSASPIPYRESVLVVNGKERIIGVSTSIIRDAGGTVESVIAIFRDLTEEKRTQDQLRRGERLTALGELAGGVAHEIRNPLNAIGIIAQRLQAEFEPTADREEYATLTSTVRGEVERVNTIIKQFLNFARPPKLQLERIWLHVIVVDTLEVIASQAKAANVRVSLTVDDHAFIQADRNILKQALLNLCQNALEAMPDGGQLDAHVRSEEGRAVLTLSDSGQGISKEVQAKMFNLYFSTKTTGTGLGLSIVHQIISEHGGEIAVESQPGNGAVFTIRFPLAESQPSH